MKFVLSSAILSSPLDTSSPKLVRFGFSMTDYDGGLKASDDKLSS